MKTLVDLWEKYFPIVFAFVLLCFSNLIAQNTSAYQFEYRGNARINTKTGITAAMYNVNSRVYNGTPENAARQFLNENKTALGISNVSDLKFIQTIASPDGKHVEFQQTYQGIPIYGSETVVSLNNENRVSMVENGNTPITGVKSVLAAISDGAAIRNAIAKVNAEEKTLVTQPKAELNIYQDSSQQFALAWKINFIAQNPHGDWQVFIGAVTGEVLKVMNIGFRYVNGSGKVFRPDPVTGLQNTLLTDQNDADYSSVQGAYVTTALSNLNDAIGGVYRLQGIYARSEDIESPNIAPVTSSTDSFLYNRSQSGFEETNAYYFLDAQRQYVSGLGFAPQWNGYDYIRFDAHGAYGDDNSWYMPSSKYIAYGDGGIDDAEDQDVILHEYTHALHDVLMPGGLGSAGDNESAVSEGSGDYMALSYRKTLSNFEQNHIFNWDGNGETWPGRSLSSTATYPSAWQDQYGNVLEVHTAGILWSSTMMDIETSSGVGRDVANELLLASFSYVSPSSTVIDHVHAIFQADEDIYNAAHLPALASVFNARGFNIGIAYQDILLGFAYANKSTSYAASSNNNDHVLERGTIDGKLNEIFASGGEIFYRRSSDNGSTWYITTRLSTGNGSNQCPSIVAGYGSPNDMLRAVWQRQLDGTHYEIWSANSTNGGGSWSTPAIVNGASNVTVSYHQSNANGGPGCTLSLALSFTAAMKE